MYYIYILLLYHIKKYFGHKTIADATKIDDIKHGLEDFSSRIRIQAQINGFMGSLIDLFRNTFPK